MVNPDWASIKSADSTYSAMIAAWWAAISTTLGMIFAAVAVRWARKAALEAGRQAKAASESLQWSQKAAEAALAQTALLRKQLEYSEPQPIVILEIVYEKSDEGRKLPVIELRNVGEEAAFDIRTSELRMVVKTRTENVRRFAFQTEAILLARETCKLKRAGARLVYPNDHEWLLRLFETSYEAMPAVTSINEKLMESGEADPENFASIGLEPMRVTYRNARGKRFEQKFCLMDEGPDFLIFAPVHSLVRHDSEAD
jgi:hypothetical protein